MRSFSCSHCNLDFILTFLGAFNQCYQRQSTSLFSCSKSIVSCHEKTTGIKSNILCFLSLALHFCWCQYVTASNHRITSWFGMEGTLKITGFQPPSVGLLPPTDQACPRLLSAQPWMPPQWDTHSFPGQPVPRKPKTSAVPLAACWRCDCSRHLIWHPDYGLSCGIGTFWYTPVTTYPFHDCKSDTSGSGYNMAGKLQMWEESVMTD